MFSKILHKKKGLVDLQGEGLELGGQEVDNPQLPLMLIRPKRSIYLNQWSLM
jgi:hypothetical protein